MKPGTPASPEDLQKVFDMAKSYYLHRHNPDYEPHIWVVLCYIRAYCGLVGLEPPTEVIRDFYAANPED